MSAPRKVLCVFGTRPEAIKMAPVVTALQQTEGVESRLCVTAQHRDMLDQVLQDFHLTADHDLNLMKPGQDLFDVTQRVLLGMRRVLEEEQPDAVLVHGDTTTCFAASLAAFYARVPVGHVEAGLRTGDLTSPFPEEANRLLTDRICHWHFAPTASAAHNLTAEGLDPKNVHITGNTVIDALLWMVERVRASSHEPWPDALGTARPALDSAAPVVLVTGHRRESFGGGFERICQALRTLAERHADVHIVYPVHLNPHVQRPVRQHLSDLPNLHLLDPLPYTTFVRLMDRSKILLTDSGGIQEEAPSLGKPVLVMRDTTERPEGLAAGTVELVGTDPQRILSATERLLSDPEAYARVQRAHNPYGDGRAAFRIAEVLAGRACPPLESS